MAHTVIFISMNKISGIYKIINKTNGKYYVGRAKNIVGRRWREHLIELIKNNHYNYHLQKSWNKYGKENFDFVIVEEIPSDRLVMTEQKYLDIAKMEKEKCYNTSFIADGVEFTNEVRKKISDKLMGNKNGMGHEVTEDMRKRISESQRGKKCPQKGNNKAGKKFSDEHKRKLSESHKGHIPTEETKQKLRERMTGSNNHNYGKRFSDEHRLKLSIAAKNRCRNISPAPVTI